jgi:hypothetical protein
VTAPPSKAGTDVRSGIQTEALLEDDPPGFRVTWIDWDSDFRRALRFNDLITGVNGRSLSPFLQPGKLAKGVGQAAEGQYWKEIGATVGQEIALAVVRDDAVVEVTGRLGTDWFHYDAAGKAALAPGGPARLATDGFDETWMGWFEKLQSKLSLILTLGLTYRGLNTRAELKSLLDGQPRIDFLLARWPGPFAQTIHDDWARAVTVVRGRQAEPPVDLEYRAIGERRVEIARAAAATAWAALLEETAPDRVPAVPAGSPLEREKWVGKTVEFPPLSYASFRSDLGKSFAAAGSPRDGYWYLLFDRPEMAAFWRVLARYKGFVNPQLAERFRFLVRVLDNAQMFTVDGHSIMGLGVEALAALVGRDEMFVDLRHADPRFAGEESLASVASASRDDADPASVVRAMIDAVKLGDEPGWRGLFAPWRVVAGGGGRPLLDMAYATRPGMFAGDWERSRRLIMGDLFDARVYSVEKVRRILARDAGTGLPDVDQAVVWVDHYGLFDGEHRVFQNVNVNRRWLLQRLDGGPWRIVSLQSL